MLVSVASSKACTVACTSRDFASMTALSLLANAYVKPVVDEDEVADRDWMQMAWLLRHELPDLFIEMLLVLRAKARAVEFTHTP